MWLDVLRLVGGLVILSYAADRLVRSAVALSRTVGVSTVVIGAVVIGFGTSVPEFVVSSVAAASGDLDLAVGNVISSNTANVTLVLGAAAVITGLLARRRVIRREGVLMLASVVVLALALADDQLDWWEGLVLLAMLVVAMTMVVRWSLADPARDLLAEEEPTRRPTVEVGIAAVALVVTVVGADLLLEGVVGLGERYGLSVVFLGLITGVGTSLPELAAAVASARHRETELAIGNVLGSNLFNSLGVMGFAALVGGGPLTAFTPALLIFMVAAAAVAGLFAFTGRKIDRTEGILLLAGFVVYAVLAF